MEKYAWLAKKQQKALNVFQAAKKDLDAVGTQIMNEIGKSKEAIDDMRSAIQEEEEAINFLHQQREQIAKQSEKITAILV